MKISQDILEILERCSIKGNILYLPPEQLDRDAYKAVNKCLENIGGKWNKKAKGHVFDHDPAEAFNDMLLTGETTDMKKLFQFFPTPREIAEKMCDMAELTEHSKVLEPSVGKGGIADVVWARSVASLLGIELNQEMQKHLDYKPYTTMVGMDFLEFAKKAKANNEEHGFTHIIMNPPFSKQQEIAHIMAAFELLAPGGILVSVVSPSPFWRTDAKSKAFRDWLYSEDSFEYEEEIDLPEGTFKESGTMIPTKIIKLRRDGVLNEQATTAISQDSVDGTHADHHVNEKTTKPATSKLIKVSYYDAKEEIGLECYADTVVIEEEEKRSYIAAIRLGGYPESVKGMSDAIYGGGSITFDIDEEEYEISGKVKQYRREYSHDGLYAEAVLWILDEDHRQISSSDENNGSDESTTDNEVVEIAPRKCYIFCTLDDSEHLFEAVDEKTSVPLIHEFKDYVISELKRRDILKPLKIITSHEKFDAWVFCMEAEEVNVISVVNDGLRRGKISIPGAVGTDFPEISGVTQYLSIFGVQIAERIKGQFNPRFDPATERLSLEVNTVNNFIIENAGYSLYDAQLAVVEALKRGLECGKDALCIAECGSGKTKIGISALHAYQQRPIFRKYNDGMEISDLPTHRKRFNIVLCPSHMAKKWVREIEESLPNTFAVIVTSITELHIVYAAYLRDNMSCYIIITKEKARDGYMVRPVARWHKRRKVFICPACDKAIEMELSEGGSKYRVPANALYFRKENRKNHICDNEECGEVLWTALTPEEQSEWVKVANYGFVHRQMAWSYFEHVEKKPKIYEAVRNIAFNPDDYYPNSGAYRRFPLSTYIKNKMKGKIDGLIIDELHHYNNNSGQGDAMGELFQAAKKVIGMTATLINGYSSGIFHLLYRMSSELMLLDNKSYDNPQIFNAEYGVTESVYEITAPDYNSNRRTVKRKIRERQLPGVSPLVYSRFLLEKAVFLSLNDMGKDLPEYEEIPVQLRMNDEIAHEYYNIEKAFVEICKHDMKLTKKVQSAFLNLRTVYPDQPYGHQPIKHPFLDDCNLYVPEDTSSFDELHEKDDYVLDLVHRKIKEGERVLIYTSWIRIDTQTKLTKLLTEQGYRVATLTANVEPKKREEWVEKQVQNGIQVLITNPSLVETGLDLNDFTTLLYYNISYKLFTLRQASRRSWRINQRAPRIEVYFFYYAKTVQEKAIRLMASKLAVAGVIEGNLTDEGLAAMSDCQDMTTELAREITQGIEGEVEDLRAIFKRMALLKPVSDVIEGEAVVVNDVVVDSDKAIVISNPSTPVTDVVAQSVREQAKPKQPSGLMSMIDKPKPKRKGRKAATVLENQMSLFDLMDTPA